MRLPANDYEMGLRHDLPLINVFTRHAAISDAARNCSRHGPLQARSTIVGDLEALGLLERIEPHRLKAPGVTARAWLWSPG